MTTNFNLYFFAFQSSLCGSGHPISTPFFGRIDLYKVGYSNFPKQIVWKKVLFFVMKHKGKEKATKEKEIDRFDLIK